MENKRYSELALAVTPNTANERMRAFFEDLGELRQKHGIPDIHCIVQQNILTESGESPGLCTIHSGDERNAMSMCSYAMGHATGEHQKFVLQARANGMKVGADIAMKAAKKVQDDLFGSEDD